MAGRRATAPCRDHAALARKPLLIVQTGTALSPIRRRLGDFPHWFRIGLGLRPDQVQVVDARGAHPLPSPGGARGVVVTGSGSMVSEREAWSEATASWLRDAVAARTPVLGVCYGHQLLAHAFGGVVDYNPRGREMGTVRIELAAAAQDDRLLSGLPQQLAVHATHLQSVIQAPPEAAVLARSALDDCHALRIGESAWGVQFHPEFSTAAMRAYIRERAAAIRSEGSDPVLLARAVSPAPRARRLLRRFAGLCANP